MSPRNRVKQAVRSGRSMGIGAAAASLIVQCLNAGGIEVGAEMIAPLAAVIGWAVTQIEAVVDDVSD